MSFGTVSFEELLGHCYQVFNKNQTDLLDLEDRLKPLGYLPQLEIDDEEEEEEVLDSKDKSFAVTSSAMKSLEEDPFLDESLSLKNLGLSDVCIATLASQANDTIEDSDYSFRENIEYNVDKSSSIKGICKPATDTFEVTKAEVENDQNPVEAQKPAIQVSKDGYGSLPSYMTSLASWEDLLAAVEKINSRLSKKEKTKGYFHQDEIESLNLGPKGRAYLLLLVRMNHLVVETIDGLISYRVL
ncbi:hypothetical protein COLO4_29462 [Corchorus olitorius]|uniref:Uncharacterized protein n=1 Tax=Corchorus olitorius TaxID=93759 RepID=A0A1R3HEB9_9ROSI|nr:hypothetical protein COLO4_29462 [Corchorus olitorius]